MQALIDKDKSGVYETIHRFAYTLHNCINHGFWSTVCVCVCFKHGLWNQAHT